MTKILFRAIDAFAGALSLKELGFEGVEAAATGRPKVATEMALHVLAYNLTRVMNIIGIKPLMAAIQA